MASAETTSPDLPDLVAIVCEPEPLPPALDTCESHADPHNPDLADRRRLRDLFWYWVAERSPYVVIRRRKTGSGR